MKIVEPAAMRYPTAGDWEWLPDGALKLTVPGYGTQEEGALLILLHELVEAYLCRRDGISDEAVTKFDVENPLLEEPGDDPAAPYHRQHMIAMAIEKEAAIALSVDWDAHNEWVVRAGNEVERLDKLGELKQSGLLVLGPACWAELHLYALRTEGKGRYHNDWFAAWYSDIPFGNCPCKEHADKWLLENPIDNSDFFAWTIRMHNAVSERIGKNTLSVEDARRLWQNRIF